MTRSDVTQGTGFPNNTPVPGSLEAECRALGIDPSGVLDFSGSLNPLGPPQCIDTVLQQGVKLASTYPDLHHDDARTALARAHNVDPQTILIGNGSTELLHLITRHFHADRTLVLGPSRADYVRAAELAGSRVDLKLATPARLFRHDVAAMRHLADYHLVILGNPGSFTGMLWRLDEIVEWAAENPEVFFLVDEAYMDFVDRAHVSMIGINCPNIVVMKSFGAFFGIPGLRLGMLWASSEVVNVLRARREPCTVNRLAQKAATMLYGEQGYVSATHRLLSQERSFLTRGLTELGFRVFDSPASFLLLRIEYKKLTASLLKTLALRNGVFVRDCSDVPGLGENFVRVAVRRRHENERLIEAIEKLLREAGLC